MIQYDIPACIDGIFAALTKLNRPIADKRRPGLLPEAIEAVFDELGLDLPEDVAAFYSQLDGTDHPEGVTIGDICIFPGYYLESLAHMRERYLGLQDSELWDPSWFPIFYNGGEDYYAVICDEASPHHGAVVGFVNGAEGGGIEYASLSVLLKTIETGFERKVIFVEEGGFMDMEDEELEKIANDLQPGFLP